MIFPQRDQQLGSYISRLIATVCSGGLNRICQAVIFDFEGVIATVDRELVTTLWWVHLAYRAMGQELLGKGRNGGKEEKKSTNLCFAMRIRMVLAEPRADSGCASGTDECIALKEIPGMLDLVYALQKKGLSRRYSQMSPACRPR